MKKKRKIVSRLKKYLIGAGLLVLLLWVFVPMPQLIKSNRELAELKKQLAKAEAENARLNNEIDAMKKDKYIELTARKELGLGMPGEETYVVVRQQPKPAKKKPPENKQQNIIGLFVSFFANLFK